MFPNVLQALRSYFGRDFLLGVFFPVLIFVGVNLMLFFEVTQGLASALAAWEKLSLQSQLLSILAALIVVLVLSNMIYNFQYGIIRLFEGYWPRNVLRLRIWRSNLYRRRWDYLETQRKQSTRTFTEKQKMAEAIARAKAIESAAEQFTYYPPAHHLSGLMPTRLGNILRTSELYAYDRYGIDSVIIWTRLRPLLGSEVVAALEASGTARDFMLLMSVLSVALTLIWCPVLAIFTSNWQLFLLCSLGWPLAWICYHSAVQSTLAFSEQVKVVFDLHRNDLLKALNRKIPSDAEAERKEWKRLSLFFYGSHELKPSPPEPEKPRSLDEVVAALAEFLKNMTPPTS